MGDKNVNVRKLSYEVLYDVCFNDKLLNNRLSESSIKIANEEDRSFLKRECTGVIEKIDYIDSVIDRFSKVKTRKLDKEILLVLRIGTYEILFMEKVPSYATINECVDIVKHTRKANLSNYVNAILRSIDRDENIKRKDISNDPKKNCYFRIYNDNENLVLAELDDKKIEYKKYSGKLNFRYVKVYKTSNYKDVIELKNFNDGNILISDASSIYLTDILAYYIKEREKKISLDKNKALKMIKILDTCASPGGKILGLIDLIYSDYYYFYAEARDVSEEKIYKICENTNRLKVLDLNLNVKDARDWDELDRDKYDVVISDVPCTGLGVITKKPDTAMHFTEDKLLSLVDIQKRIIESSSKCVKPGGLLSYSTCTTTKEENEDIVSAFLEKNENFSKLYEKRIDIGDENECDGFYMCIMERKK